MQPIRLIQKDEACQILGIGRTTIHHDINAGLMTRPCKTHRQRAVWPLHEVQTIAAAKSAGLPLDNIRKLVKQLHARRMSLAAEMLASAGVDADIARGAA
jgi:predicted DNA-binding transcriptional regulator AlpA